MNIYPDVYRYCNLEDKFLHHESLVSRRTLIMLNRLPRSLLGGSKKGYVQPLVLTTWNYRGFYQLLPSRDGFN
jgi:hypothetical protein